VDIGVPSLNGSGPVACFGTAIQRGYGAAISNRVVDAIGDLAGGIRLHGGDQPDRSPDGTG
jgi:3-hydroxyisobutyrate dehydrogenase